MKIKFTYFFFIGVIMLIIHMSGMSQVMSNNSGLIYTASGSVVTVNGGLTNGIGSQFSNNGDLTIIGDLINHATLQSSGTIMLSGNWTNNATFIHNNGDVFLEGGNQTIGGVNPSAFYNLTLQGTGVKSQNQNVNIKNSLNLNDREMDVANFYILIENPALNAITRTTGFVSNNLQGRLIRKTNSSSAYLFPLGSSLTTQRYRPVEITPDQTNTCKFSAGFINHDANTDGFNRNLMDNELCLLNDKFYHHISLDSGITHSQVAIYFNPVTDGNWNISANWNTSPLNHWATIDSTSYNSGNPLSAIHMYDMIFSGTSAYIIAKPAIKVDLGNNLTGCQGDVITLSTDTTFTTYSWSMGAITSTVDVTNSGTYYVTVTAGGCSATDSVTVTLASLPVANAGSDVSVCSGLSTQLNASGGTTYNWLTTSGLSSTNINNPVASPTTTTSYIVDISNGTCHNQDTVVVTVLNVPVVNAGPDTTIYSGKPYQMTTFAPTGTTFIWNPANGLSNSTIANPVATLNETTVYTFTVNDVNGCTASDMVTINVIPNPELIIYNTFTPNSDGVNDTWVVENISQYPDNHLRIYNRNGHVVYDKNGYNNEWDGKYFGSDLPAATYYFVLEIEGVDTFKGDVTIIR